MSPWVLAILVVLVSSGVGLVWRGRDGRLRRGSRERIRASDVALPGDAFGPRATLLQFSTPQCARSPAARRLLTTIADGTPGVQHADVDLAERGDLAGKYAVFQTPTTFVLDSTGRLTARIAGRPSRQTVLLALATTSPAGDWGSGPRPA